MQLQFTLVAERVVNMFCIGTVQERSHISTSEIVMLQKLTVMAISTDGPRHPFRLLFTCQPTGASRVV
jgi:hypothetical protein